MACQFVRAFGGAVFQLPERGKPILHTKVRSGTDHDYTKAEILFYARQGDWSFLSAEDAEPLMFTPARSPGAT